MRRVGLDSLDVCLAAALVCCLLCLTSTLVWDLFRIKTQLVSKVSSQFQHLQFVGTNPTIKTSKEYQKQVQYTMAALKTHVEIVRNPFHRQFADTSHPGSLSTQAMNNDQVVCFQ